MNNLKIFENPEFGQVRSVKINGEPYFVGKDIAEILGYVRPSEAIRKHVDYEDTSKWRTLTDGGAQEVLIINESGLYSLVLSSKLPKAKEFKRWVTKEVLPTIRKTGGYVADADLMVSTYFADKTFEDSLILYHKIKQDKRKATRKILVA